MYGDQTIAHVSEEALERYALGGATEPEECQIETHLLTCEQCQLALTSEEKLIEWVRLAFTRPRSHMTNDGVVRVWVERQGDAWVGHVEGATLSSASKTMKPGAAMVLAAQVFAAAFPGHRCSASCADIRKETPSDDHSL